MPKLAFEVHVDHTFESSVDHVTAALKAEGFGVLTRIDVRATLKEKLGVDFRPYAILGACNPVLAHRALAHRPEAGLLLPCNVTVEAAPEGGTMVRIADPRTMLDVGDLSQDHVLQEVARDARRRLEHVAQLLEESCTKAEV